ncbi:Asp23/Gls24 family envelope stress response protein [Rhodococcoides kyotonense]|uniref:Asp23/Gls24 family envelope stress response protein n=1 Tax=Rhodococcoides kyotonense TaxID=398843 RepID=A0A239MD56_9NOCA|nr:Asp23/Gls24 family envelope stress response protein [Rhodococcus kyotonensis]SNT40957.1 hypothetical protein SAMN05421642_117108 [Rhodococcus kyotonensis]
MTLGDRDDRRPRSDTGGDDGRGVDLSETLARTVTATEGVAGLHGGMFGEVATYLPGRRVAGIRLSDSGIDVHISLRSDAPVRETADAVRRAVHAVVDSPIHVTVEDIVE